LDYEDVQRWCRVDLQEKPIYSLEGNTDTPRARFPDGRFEPLEAWSEGVTVEQYSSIYSIARGWNKGTSIFIWNPKDSCWDQFDEEKRNVVGKWKLLKD
jgi:hypothetical protein